MEAVSETYPSFYDVKEMLTAWSMVKDVAVSGKENKAQSNYNFNFVIKLKLYSFVGLVQV